MTISNQRIIESLHNDYGINIVTLTRIPLGADMLASVYKAQSHDQVSYFIKLKHNHHRDIGVTIQQLLHDTGIKEVMSPIKTKHGQPIQQIDEFTLIVYPFIEGKDGFSLQLTDAQWIMFGKALKRIHQFNVPLTIKNQINYESYSPQWRESVQALYAHIDATSTDETSTDGSSTNGPSTTNTIALKTLIFLQEHKLTIQRLINRAEQLYQEIKKTSPELVLCHSDIHAGNVLMQENGAIYIVDWDAPIMAPKERDLMFINGGVGNVWNNAHEEKLFYKGYGKTNINMTILAYYRHERIVEDIAFYSKNLCMTVARDDIKRQQMYQHFIDIFKPQGVVDIAFKTDINY